MSRENENRDPRSVMAREKFFTLRPKPLERWIWQQNVPPSAERVYWMHWEEGVRRGDYCSELSLKQVARECALDVSTVTRSYQVLKRLGLLRREEPGRDPLDPFRQLIAITEVLLPREILVNLSRYPSRIRPENAPPAVQVTAPTPAASRSVRIERGETKALLAKLSPRENSEYFVATQARKTSMRFDDDTKLNAEERGTLLALITQISSSRPEPSEASKAPARAVSAGPRKLSPLETARVRSAVFEVAPIRQAEELFRQVLWSIEQGALLKFDPRMALNVALKKIREGAWTCPNRLPSRWLATARPETCSAA